MTEFTGLVVGFDYFETDVVLLLQHEEELIAKDQLFCSIVRMTPWRKYYREGC